MRKKNTGQTILNELLKSIMIVFITRCVYMVDLVVQCLRSIHSGWLSFFPQPATVQKCYLVLTSSLFPHACLCLPVVDLRQNSTIHSVQFNNGTVICSYIYTRSDIYLYLGW